jgi:hypothetical protein
MENEQNEVIIDSTENNEVVLEEKTEEGKTDTVEVAKPVETDEAKHSRLKRQLDQHEKKMGIVKPQAKPVVEQRSDTSVLDAMALLKANIQEEDFEDVNKFAKGMGLTIAQALKNVGLKAILAEKEETRTTANVSNVNNVKRGVQKVSGETLLARAKKGDMPESDDDIRALVKASMKK